MAIRQRKSDRVRSPDGDDTASIVDLANPDAGEHSADNHSAGDHSAAHLSADSAADHHAGDHSADDYGAGDPSIDDSSNDILSEDDLEEVDRPTVTIDLPATVHTPPEHELAVAIAEIPVNPIQINLSDSGTQSVLLDARPIDGQFFDQHGAADIADGADEVDANLPESVYTRRDRLR